MTRHRSDLTKGSPLPSTWVNSLMEFMSTVVTPNFAVTKVSSNTVQVVAGTGNDQVGLGINGRWRFNVATVGPISVPGGGAPAIFDVFVTAADNDFSQADPADATNYGFSVAVMAQGQTPATALYRRVATVYWDGTQITRINSLFGVATALTYRIGHTWVVTGPVVAGTLPGFFVPAAVGQTNRLTAIRGKLQSGTSVGVQLLLNGTPISGATATLSTTPATTNLGSPPTLNDGDEVACTLSTPTGGPVGASVAVVIDTTA